jgi:hypothetical protein
MVHRDKDTGLVSFPDAYFGKKYGYGESTIRRARKALIEKGLLCLEKRHSNDEDSSNSYSLPPTPDWDAHKAKRRAAASARRQAGPQVAQPAPVGGATAAQDAVSAAMTPEEQEASDLAREVALSGLAAKSRSSACRERIAARFGLALPLTMFDGRGNPLPLTSGCSTANI